MSATSANGFTADRRVTGHLRIADGPLDVAGDGHLDHVAAMTALHDGPATGLREHRRRHVAGIAGGARRRACGWRARTRRRLVWAPRDGTAPADRRPKAGDARLRTSGGTVASVTRPTRYSMPDVAAHPDFPTLHVSSHPAVQHKLALLRDETTEPKKFRELVREISWLVGYEALQDARTAPIRGTDTPGADRRCAAG